MAPSFYFLHFLGLVIVLIGLNLRPKRKKLGTSLAVLGFLIGTAPVWYNHLVAPSPSELREQQRQEFMVPADQ
jgi:disulfide bond formation protein DsbB